jgi:hypothetical protein
MDLESLQAGLKRTLFFWTHTELTHVCIHRLHDNDGTSQGIPLPERRRGQLDIL